MAKEIILRHVDREINSGNLWRAKEILQGSIASTVGYDVDIYEKYGQILLQMQDNVEAGKFLFLSGKRCLHYEKAIELFLKKYAKRHDYTLYYAFPRAARLAKKNDYPETVASYLTEHNFRDFVGTQPQKQHFLNSKINWGSGFLVYFLLFIFLLGLGYIFYSGFKFLYILLFGKW